MRSAIIIAALPAAFAAAYLLTPPLARLDDSYIALHSARVVLSGHDPVFNVPALVGATKMFPADLEKGTPPIPIPVGRIGRPDEMADMAIAMLRNGYLTNKVITLDGGIVPRN